MSILKLNKQIKQAFKTFKELKPRVSRLTNALSKIKVFNILKNGRQNKKIS